MTDRPTLTDATVRDERTVRVAVSGLPDMPDHDDPRRRFRPDRIHLAWVNGTLSTVSLTGELVKKDGTPAARGSGFHRYMARRPEPVLDAATGLIVWPQATTLADDAPEWVRDLVAEHAPVHPRPVTS